MHSIFLRQDPSGSSGGGGGGATETSTARATDLASQTEPGSSTPAGSSTSPPQSTTAAPESSTQQTTSTPPETTSTAEQTSTNRESSSTNSPESTSEGPTATSNSPTSTSDTPTSTADSQTSSSPSQTSATETATASETPTPSATPNTTSQNTSTFTPSDTQSSSSASRFSSPTNLSSSSAPTLTATTAPAGSSAAPPATTSTPAFSQSPFSRTSSGPGTTTSGVTSVVVTVVSSINGTPTTFTTVVPTLATNPNGTSVLTARTSAIVGGVVGGTLALISLLIMLFYLGRRRRKLAIARNAPRLQAPRQMLDTDDFDLAEPPGPAPYPYGTVGARASPNASGSIFHEVLPGTAAHHSHTRSLVNENDPLLAQHLRGGSVDVDSIQTSSPRESTHYRASSSTGLLFDANDPFGDHSLPISAGSVASRTHPAAIAKAREARSRAADPHVYPPSAYHAPPSTHGDIPHTYHPTGSGVLVHQDAGRVDVAGTQETPPGYTRQGRSNYSP